MENFIIVAVVLLVVGAACFYIVKEKKRGRGCIGCPMAMNGSCAGHCKSAKSAKKNTTTL